MHYAITTPIISKKLSKRQYSIEIEAERTKSRRESTKLSGSVIVDRHFSEAVAQLGTWQTMNGSIARWAKNGEMLSASGEVRAGS